MWGKSTRRPVRSSIVITGKLLLTLTGHLSLLITLCQVRRTLSHGT